MAADLLEQGSWSESALHRPTIALSLIAKGEEQVIAVDYLEMLGMIMRDLGAREQPAISRIKSGAMCMRVEIKIDVSYASHHPGRRLDNIVVSGDASGSVVVAEKSAVHNVISYRSTAHMIKVNDFSTRVIQDIMSNKTPALVHTAFSFVDRVLTSWEFVMTMCEDLRSQLQQKGSNVTSGCANEDGAAIYQSMSEALDGIIYNVKYKVTGSRMSLSDLSVDHNKHGTMISKRSRDMATKEYVQEATIQTRVILNYVLGYLGSGPATYIVKPSYGQLTKATVLFEIPRIRGIEFSGTIQQKGKAKTPEQAEEAAAYRALQYMEKQYRLTIVDFNRQERDEVHKEHRLILDVLEELLDIGDDVKNFWGDMLKEFSAEDNAFAAKYGAVSVLKPERVKLEHTSSAQRRLMIYTKM